MMNVYSPSGIAYNWMFFPEAYSELFTVANSQSVSHLRCKWDDAGDLKADLMYSAQRNPGQTYLLRNNAIAHPEIPWHYLQQMNKYKLFLDSTPKSLPGTAGYGYPTQAFDTKTGFWSMDKIVYQCSFNPLPFDVKKDKDVKGYDTPELYRYCTIQTVPQTLNRKVPGLPFVFDVLNSDGSAFSINETASVPETTYKLIVSLYGWPETSVPYAAIFDRSNKVNDSSLVIPPVGGFPGGTFAQETVRYDGLASPIEPSIGPDGVRYVTIRHVLNVHPVANGWNRSYDHRSNPPTWGYFKVQNSAPPKRRYLLSSFKELFIPV